MERNEKTSAEVASIAARAMHDPGALEDHEVRTLAASCLTQAPDKGEAQGLPVAGYKATQPAWAIEAVNAFKALEERALRAIESLDGAAIDPRAMALGRTHLQTGFMWAARAVFQPGRVKLPEDDQGDLEFDNPHHGH